MTKSDYFFLVLHFSVYRASSINTNGSGSEELNAESGSIPASGIAINETGDWRLSQWC